MLVIDLENYNMIYLRRNLLKLIQNEKLFLLASCSIIGHIQRRLLISFYVSVLPILKRYLMLYEMKEPRVHTLYEEQNKLLSEFFACFMKSESFANKSSKELKEIRCEKKTILN